MGSPAEKTIQVYPNPVKAISTIACTVENPTGASIQLFNTQGQLVRSIDAHIFKPGRNLIPLNMMEMPCGTYFLKAGIDGCTSTIKVLKQ
jgi:hypothetical protein